MDTNVTAVNTIINNTITYACFGVFGSGKPERLDNYFACSQPTPDNPFVPCCEAGANSYCMSEGYCYGPASNNAQTTFRYYPAACTDPSANDKTCSSHCKGLSSNTAWYNLTTSLWECCDPDDLTGGSPLYTKCSKPASDERWANPHALLLDPTATVPASSIATYLTASHGMQLEYSTTSGSGTSSAKVTQAPSASASASGSVVKSAGVTVAGDGVHFGRALATFAVLALLFC